MADFPEEYEHTVVEPDENVLIAALRNQDDIPILMDIVGDHVSLNVSQEVHFSEKMHNESSENQHSLNNLSSDMEQNSTALSEAETSGSINAERIQAAVQKAIEKFLPDIVSEVVKELQVDSKTN